MGLCGGVVPEFLRYTIYIDLGWSLGVVTGWPGCDPLFPPKKPAKRRSQNTWCIGHRYGWLAREFGYVYKSNSGRTPWGTLTNGFVLNIEIAGWKLRISFQIASIYGYLYVKFQWGKSKKFRSSFDISWAGNFTMKVDVQYICPIGQLGDIFCSCTS